jgi:magnesium transporter
MVGFVTVDDVIDVLTDEATEDVLKMAAVKPDPGGRTYFEYPLAAVVRNRVGWLLLLFVAGTFTSGVLRHYESELATAVALSFFVPLLIGTGGNAGSQAVMTVIRSLALGEIGVRHAWRVVAKEATVGVLLGSLVGTVAYVAARFWGAHGALALTVSLAMVAICLWSTTVGSLIPIAAQRFGVDPAVLSAPLISTLVDATGLVIYFEIARAVLRL